MAALLLFVGTARASTPSGLSPVSAINELQRAARRARCQTPLLPLVAIFPEGIVDLTAQLAEQLYSQACEVEAGDPKEAANLYQRALQLDVMHVDAHVNLGRLLQEEGALEPAEQHYRFALFVRPDDAIASFNLATLLEDRGEADEALVQYQRVLEVDPRCADAHFNLARLHEVRGDALPAFRHLKEYRLLLRGESRAGVALA